MSRRGGINPRFTPNFQRALQKDLDKHPVYVPVVADYSTVSSQVPAPPPVVNNYGPVFHGNADGAQLAWSNSGVVHQQAERSETVAVGYEEISAAVTDVLRGLPSAALDDEVLSDAVRSSEDALEEVTKRNPDRSVLRRAVSALRGFLVPVATGVSAGAAEGAQEWAQHAIASLGAPF